MSWEGEGWLSTGAGCSPCVEGNARVKQRDERKAVSCNVYSGA